MSKNEYDIDDILLEAERLRKTMDGSPSIGEDTQNLVDIKDTKTSDKEKTVEDSKEDFFKFVDNSSGVNKKEDESKAEEPKTELNYESRIEPRHEIKRETEPVSSKVKSDVEVPKSEKLKQGGRSATRPSKKDLFDFKPEKREAPIKSPFGKKSFDFTKPETIFKVDNKEKKKKEEKAEVATSEQNYIDETFDFASISEKIEKMNEEIEKPVSPRRQTPFQFGGGVQSISDKAKSRSRYADLASGSGGTGELPKRFSFDFNKNATVPRDEDEGTDHGDIFATDHTSRRSLFSTFTGTGKELKLEDIKKIDFSEVEGAGGGYLDGEYLGEEDYYNEYDFPDGRTMELGEFRPETDRREVSKEIVGIKMGYFIRTLLTGVVTFILFYFAFAAKYPSIPMLPFIQPELDTLNAYVLACTILTGLVAGICIHTVWSGIVSTVTMKANSDALPTFALAAAILQGIVAMRNPELIKVEAVSLYFSIAALSMLFNCISKLVMLSRIQQNFKISASKQEKNTVLAVNSHAYARELVKNTAGYRTTIAYGAKADFFTDFLALSSSNKYDVGVNRSVVPVCLIAAVVVAIATRFLSGNPMTAITSLAAVLCICATLSTAFIENIPLNKMAKKLAPMGAMVSGNKAVEKFCDTDAIILTENDLFPKGHVYLNGIKAFPNARIDEAILDAASVLCALGGSLSYVFLDMIGGDRQLLKKVDNVVYENGMGLSGWVDGRRVIIGNRKLMQNHEISLPVDSYESKNPKETPGNPIYLSNSGEVSARFLVEYLIDEELAYQLDILAAKEKQIVIYTTDANIDAKKIWELYRYPVDLINIMPSELQDNYRQITTPRKETPAEIAYIGRPAAMIAAIIASINARASILSATIIQLVQIVLGYGIVALMSFMGYIESFSIIQLGMYQAFWFVAIMIVQQSRKP